MENFVDNDCNRPYVICHMVTSLDGKVTGPFLEEAACAEATELYYEINRGFKADGFACGSVINGAFQRAGVIDELSLVVAPFIAGDTGKPLFTDGDLQKFSLFQAEKREGNAMWLRYRR